MCYLTNWSHRRPGAGKFVPEDIDPTLCTHIVYSFATLKNYLLAEESEKDTEMYERLIALRNKNPDIKVGSYFSYILIDIDTFDTYFNTRPRYISIVLMIFQILLAIGGWAFGSTPFKELTSNTFRMNQFVYEAIEFLREYKFDGLDVDWEYPR